MASPKDYLVYIDKDNKTCAVIIDGGIWLHKRAELQDSGLKIIGYVSSGSEKEAIQYGDQVLR